MSNRSSSSAGRIGLPALEPNLSKAARGYFDTTPNALIWAQAAMLAGLPAAPITDDPLAHYARAKQRQQHVLNQLVVNHDLTAAQARAAYAEPLGLT